MSSLMGLASGATPVLNLGLRLPASEVKARMAPEDRVLCCSNCCCSCNDSGQWIPYVQEMDRELQMPSTAHTCDTWSQPIGSVLRTLQMHDPTAQLWRRLEDARFTVVKGSHDIMAVDDAVARISSEKGATQVCSACGT